MMIETYVAQLLFAVDKMEATTRMGRAYRDPFATFFRFLKDTHEGGRKVIIIGNGGSAGIASHTAIDFCKAGGVRAMTMTDGAALTCLSNDLGYEEVYAEQLRYLGRYRDLLIAISSSGESENILRAVAAADKFNMLVVTFSGFVAGNPLRRLGELNFYVPASHYGFVELSHQIFLHAIVDALAESKNANLAESRPQLSA